MLSDDRTLSEWISDEEHRWRSLLQPVSLVIETDFSEDDVRQTQRKFGSAIRQLAKQDVPHRKIIKRYPALTLLTLVGHAALAYDHGAYWESYWDEMGLVRDADFENDIRRSIVDILDKFSLARFPDIERESNRKYVMMLALHAGIPIHSLRDLLVVINDHITQGRPATGAAVMEWLREPGKEHRTLTLDVPVRNFLVNGAEFAADILDRIIEFIQEATVDPAIFDRDLNSGTTGLPSVLLDELIQQLKDAPLQIPRRRNSAGTVARPSVVYLVDDDEIVLELPTPAEGTDSPWRVSLDGEVREVHAGRTWGGGNHTATARAAVPGPIREAIVSHPATTSSSLPLVVQADPLLIFDDKGRHIARRDGLKDSVWAVFPEDHQLVDAYTGRQVEYQDSGSPAGWLRWRSVFVELDDVGALQLQRDEVAVGTQRLVRKDARPRFILGEPTAGVVTLQGHTVYGERPWVMLPAAHTSPPAEWKVQVRRVGDTDWLVSGTWLGDDEETCVDPFNDAEDAQLGHFEILVTGPMGSDARCVVFLLEGISARFEPAIRTPVAGGLSTCTATIEVEGDSEQSNDPIPFGINTIDKQLDVHNETGAVSVLIRPPHVQIRSGETGIPIAWRMTPDAIDPEDFAQDRFVAIRAPGVDRVDLHYLSDLGDLIQTDASPKRRQGDVFESRTQQFADTARRHPNGCLVATLRTDAGSVDVTVLLARPRLLASGANLVDNTLVFSDVAAVDGLSVHVWKMTAPWRAPESFPVMDGRATLPEHFVDAGELRCQLFIDDPWVAVEAPAVPAASAFRVEQPGWSKDGTAEQVLLARHIATGKSALHEVGVRPEVWTALATLHADDKRDRFAALIEVLTADPRTALECLGDSTISASDKMAMLIRSELVNHNFTAEVTSNELHPHPWFGCMVELADLPSLYNRRREVPAERAETLAYLRDRGGEPLTELLRTGKTARFHDTCFDSTVLELGFVPGNRIEAKLNEIQQVPRAQLDHANLRAGVYEGLCRRNQWGASGWSSNFEQQLSMVLTPVKRASRLAHETITIRLDRLRGIDTAEHPWMLMSAQSLTLAFLARLEAYGRIEGRYLNSGLLRNWAQMAQLCPTLVANDLLIAEAAVLYDRRGDLIGEDE
ncbi:hypothetical protein [Mycolicibacterium bacteremicum]|uniref:hypothetical protein n=1 Tax=Mycolicibacterium bacteremicum TaxID=564198 RepID=UPI0026ECE551|nr:hypothetical protein [Mycolicibacterium bacteremicum]